MQEFLKVIAVPLEHIAKGMEGVDVKFILIGIPLKATQARPILIKKWAIKNKSQSRAGKFYYKCKKQSFTQKGIYSLLFNSGVDIALKDVSIITDDVQAIGLRYGKRRLMM